MRPGGRERVGVSASSLPAELKRTFFCPFFAQAKFLLLLLLSACLCRHFSPPGRPHGVHHFDNKFIRSVYIVIKCPAFIIISFNSSNSQSEIYQYFCISFSPFTALGGLTDQRSKCRMDTSLNQ